MLFKYLLKAQAERLNNGSGDEYRNPVAGWFAINNGRFTKCQAKAEVGD